MRKEVTNPKGLPPTGNRYSHVVKVSDAKSLVFIAGQTAMDERGNIVGKGDFRAQAEQVFRNLRKALEAHGLDFQNLVQMTIYLTDIRHREVLHEVRARYLGDVQPPTSTLVAVSALAHPDYLLEIDAIAVAGD